MEKGYEKNKNKNNSQAQNNNIGYSLGQNQQRYSQINQSDPTNQNNRTYNSNKKKNDYNNYNEFKEGKYFNDDRYFKDKVQTNIDNNNIKKLNKEIKEPKDYKDFSEYEDLKDEGEGKNRNFYFENVYKFNKLTNSDKFNQQQSDGFYYNEPNLGANNNFNIILNNNVSQNSSYKQSNTFYYNYLENLKNSSLLLNTLNFISNIEGNEVSDVNNNLLITKSRQQRSSKSCDKAINPLIKTSSSLNNNTPLLNTTTNNINNNDSNINIQINNNLKFNPLPYQNQQNINQNNQKKKKNKKDNNYNIINNLNSSHLNIKQQHYNPTHSLNSQNKTINNRYNLHLINQNYLETHYPKILNLHRKYSQYNKIDITNGSTYYIIKSFNIENIHKAIKYGVWSTTYSCNNTFDKAYTEAKSRGAEVYLFFSTNSTFAFQGLARLNSKFQSKSFNFWKGSDKYKAFQGSFEIEWVVIKDVPNSTLDKVCINNIPFSKMRNGVEINETDALLSIKLIEAFYYCSSLVLSDFMRLDIEEKGFDKR